MWVGTYQEGVFRIEKSPTGYRISHYVKGNTRFDISSNEIRDFMEDREGRIWMGTKGGGISLFKYSSSTFTHIQGTDARRDGLSENHVMDLFQDQQGIIWIGLSYSGIDKYDPARNIFRTIRKDHDMSQNGSIFTIYGKQDQLYLGTTDRLMVYSTTNHQFESDLGGPSSRKHFEVYNISEDSDGNLWIVTTDQGLYRYNERQGFVSFSNSKENDRRQYFLYAVKALRSAPETWIGGHRGLERFDLRTLKWKDWQDMPPMKAVANRPVRMIHEDSRQNVWLGTLGYGLLRYDPASQQLLTFDKKNGLFCENIRSILEVGTALWIGTDCGLFQLDLKQLKVIRQYTEATPAPFNLPNDVVYGILNDTEGNLWLSSNKGLAKFSQQRGVVKTYDVTDGLQSNEFNTNCIYKHANGTMYFGGVNGVSYFNPGALRANTFIPPVKMTGITISDSVYPPHLKEIVLPHHQNFIDFEFVALNFSNVKKNQYRYKMQGIDPKWVQAGDRRTASYTNLPPGSYVFKVIGSNNDGVWNNIGTTVNITILPPWWATWWARSLLMLLLASGIYGLFRYRLVQQPRQREAEIRASLMAQEAERSRFSRELHDGIGANLSLLKMYIAAFGDTDIPLSDLKDRSEKLLAGSVDEIRRLIHDMQPRNLKELGLVKAVEDMVSLINMGNGLSVFFTSSNMPEKLPEQLEINLFRIVQELLQNAIKHSGARNVWLQFRFENETLIITYRDNGIGFDTSAPPEGNGLLNIRNRVMLLKGEMTSKSGPQGTEFHLRVAG
ncbi:hypothetical protein DYBT9275_05437 [Dyadobacter sp. CECT 9275]|uniref:Histidine kinase domain-containing protein n=2 Tax=Dyadobacter helix TaxID=2822344 RepID=A0A916JH49_9BACT|nr:hypothetical protein DYBT9275_05437 [Dyadobacter sp. CECT 9275]